MNPDSSAMPPCDSIFRHGIFRQGIFMRSIIHFLLPFFADSAADLDAATAEILETLASYGARTRAETLHAAQIIAFSMSTLEILAEAQTADLSPSLRIRFRACANGLNRSALQNETALDRSLAADVPAAAQDTVSEPQNDISDAELHAAIEHARTKLDGYRIHLSKAQSVFAPQRDAAQPVYADPMTGVLSQGAPPAIAAHGA
jgi:hypothetical protein